MSQDWPAQSSELWPIEKITPNARNSRTHSDEQVAQIAASIREWGWTNPILVDENGGLIAGHGRLLAALGKEPLLSMGLRLGEGSGAALAIGIVKAAVACHSGMATFAEAGVSEG